MRFIDYNGQKVRITRTYEVNGKQFMDLKGLNNGKEYRSVPVHKVERAETVRKQKIQDAKTVVFEDKHSNKTELVFDSGAYLAFVKKHGLNQAAIDNCLKGLTKTHKGFKIYMK